MALRNPVVDIYSFSLMFVMFCCCWKCVCSVSCLPCDTSECSLNVSTCSYGVVKDYCGCCDECLKGPGESCGSIFGVCASGFRCYVKLEYGVPYVLFVQTTGRCEGEQNIFILLYFFCICMNKKEVGRVSLQFYFLYLNDSNQPISFTNTFNHNSVNCHVLPPHAVIFLFTCDRYLLFVCCIRHTFTNTINSTNFFTSEV